MIQLFSWLRQIKKGNVYFMTWWHPDIVIWIMWIPLLRSFVHAIDKLVLYKLWVSTHCRDKTQSHHHCDTHWLWMVTWASLSANNNFLVKLHIKNQQTKTPKSSEDLKSLSTLQTLLHSTQDILVLTCYNICEVL